MSALSISLPLDALRDRLLATANGQGNVWAAPCLTQTDGEGAVETTEREDRRDVAASLKGDGEAYRRIVRRHQDAVAAMMWRFSRDPEVHEELVQDVFVEVFTSLAKFRGEAPLAHWISRIATHTGYGFWKRQARDRKRTPTSIDEWDQLPAAEGADHEAREAAEILHRLMKRLSPRDRLVLTLRHLDEKSVAETAQLTGMSETMVKVQTWRARNRLKKIYDAWEQGGDR